MARGGNTKTPIGFACSCGQLQGHISADAARSGTHIECFCADCRAAELYQGQPDPAPGGVDMFLTTPDAITITSGAEHLGLMRLGPHGPLRWYATCCSAPLFNTLANPKRPFVSVMGGRLSQPDAIGPVVAKSFVPNPGGRPKHQGATGMVWALASRMIAARLSGRWRQTPFFDVETGKPVAEAKIPSKEERAALYPA